MPVDGLPQAAIAATAERTVNGIPVSSLPAHVAMLITYEMTDQGLAERNDQRVDSQGRPHSGVQVTMNEGFDQAIAQRADATEPWECADPLKEAADKYRKPGYRYRGLSPLLCQKRTTRGWQVVVDPKTGDPVKVGNLMLGEMPEARAEKRNKHYRDEGTARLAEAVDQMHVDQEKLARAGKSRGIDVLRSGDVVTDHDDPDRHVSIGVHQTRGLQGADAAA